MSYDTYLNYVYYPVMALILIFLIVIVGIGIKNTQKDTDIQENTKMCEVGTVHPDGSVTLTEDSAGTYDYTIFTTTSGIKVLGECK